MSQRTQASSFAINRAGSRLAAVERQREASEHSEFGQWHKTGKRYIQLTLDSGVYPVLSKGGKSNPMAYFLNDERVDEARFRSAFLLEYKKLKLAYSPRKAYIDQLGRNVEEYPGDPVRLQLIEEVAGMLNVRERKATDYETVERGLAERVQVAIDAGDDVKVVKLLKDLNSFRKNRALMKKASDKEAELTEALHDKRFGTSPYAYQALIAEDAIRNVLAKNQIASSPVLDAITALTNTYAILFTNLAISVQNGDIDPSAVEKELHDKCAGTFARSADQIVQAIVGLTNPRLYVEPVTVNAVVDRAGRPVQFRTRTAFDDNPQMGRFDSSRGGCSEIERSISSSSSSQSDKPKKMSKEDWTRQYASAEQSKKQDSESEEDFNARVDKGYELYLAE